MVRRSTAPRRTRPRAADEQPPIRLLMAVPICDGHDSAINAINLEFVRAGLEIVYLGFNRSARDIVRAAIQEDVRGVGISSYNGGHVEFFGKVVGRLRDEGAADVTVFGGGGGTISEADAKVMERSGVERIFSAGTSLEELVAFVRGLGARGADSAREGFDGRLARELTRAVDGWVPRGGRKKRQASRVRGDRSGSALTIGFTGPGGVGKTLLIDELVLRFLRADPQVRIAILSHDPSIVGNGALLGDRASMIHSQDDRVFMRSLATRGQAGGLSVATARCLDVLKSATVDGEGRGFDVILVETVGIGQEAIPYGDLVDTAVLVMSPTYGARLQLQKIVMLEAADVVVVNKADLAGARTAMCEIGERVDGSGNGQRLVATTAKRHRDAGVDGLFELLTAKQGAGAMERR